MFQLDFMSIVLGYIMGVLLCYNIMQILYDQSE